ncbi:hypothetical protein RI367_008805 [Sorochytrium milnesiophthora]
MDSSATPGVLITATNIATLLAGPIDDLDAAATSLLDAAEGSMTTDAIVTLLRALAQSRRLVLSLQTAAAAPRNAPPVQTPSAHPPVPPPAASQRIRGADILFFGGRVNTLVNFLRAHTLEFRLNPSVYASDYIKVTFAATHLHGTPLSWFDNPERTNPTAHHDYDFFVERPRGTYGGPVNTDNNFARPLAKAAATSKNTSTITSHVP